MVETQLDTPRHLTTSQSPQNPLRPGAIFMHSLRENAVGIMVWGGGFSALIFVVTLLYPVLQANNMLTSILNGLGAMDILKESYAIDGRSLTTYPGYIAFQALGWAPQIFALYLIPQGIRAIMGEEIRGTLALTLSTPLPRWQFFIERVLAVIASQLLILFIMWVVFFFGAAIVDGSDISFWQTVRGILHIIPISSVIFAFTILLSVTLQNPRTATGIAALAVLASYFVRSIADMTGSDVLIFFRDFSIFRYYSSIGSMIDGPRIGVDVTLLLISATLVGLALMAFQRRELYI